MKKALTLITCGCMALILAGCGSVNPKLSFPLPSLDHTSGRDSSTTAEVTKNDLSMNSISLCPAKETVTSDDGAALFSLSFQQTQLMLHDTTLEKKILSDLQARTDLMLTDAAQIEAQAHLDYQQAEYWSEYFIDVSYTPTRLDQSVLSLFANTSSYCGGPHPSLVTGSVTYDLQTGEMLYLDDILLPDCTSDRLYQLVLKSLEDRAEDLYYDYADALGDRFTGELHSIQDWYFSRTGLCFHFSPYDIAPYSSGTIITELPYRTLSSVLKDQYIPSETSVPVTGSMYANSFTVADSERFSFITDVVLDEKGNEILLYPDATVTDLRIETGFRYNDTNQYISVATVFAASNMNIGDAVHLTANLENQDAILRLIYHSGNQEYSSYIAFDEASNSIILTTE